MLFVFFISWLIGLAEPAPPQFREQVIDDDISIGYGIALGDVDGDGKPDVLLADKKQIVWYRNGDWKRRVIAENLTEHDNVCIAAQDINGDGKVEVAVGAQWNPSETSNADQSGAVFYLKRSADPEQMWKPVRLPHEPTTHRMKWVKSATGEYYLVVLPLHGRGNKAGEGEGVKIMAYKYPANENDEWKTYILDSAMHLTHNFDFKASSNEKQSGLYVAGKEGVKFIETNFLKQAVGKATTIRGIEQGAGEVRVGDLAAGKNFIATIEPMHGTAVVVYLTDDNAKRIVLDDGIKEGHALAVSDFLGVGSDQVVAGWRSPGKEGKVGVKLYVKKDAGGTQWQPYWIDNNGMACEDIQVMDLNGDGKPDIVASGRATKNLKIYWNVSGK
ncbi:VCBS repeat-containing protein [Agriterribacter sp.]|uniref:FG-GAP repeat domain-containing protein n=1 Tax=Agriterribacter sp. TaxID=2821509 RepID=UPI002CC10088|nr:VCBS repeat-containing protein [Agriterribacter sp.]HRO48348.1 VCBS repeat-containing protein [Agriterribacter sp.]HRQ19554.1 VCBS repeat-containing protein [Agriterribacter sp.]